MPVRSPSPHDPYDKFSDHFRFAAQQLVKCRDTLKRTVNTASVEDSRETVEHAVKIRDQVGEGGKAAKAEHGGAREAIARRDWQGAVRIGVGDFRRLLPGAQGCEAPQQVDLQLDGDCASE